MSNATIPMLPQAISITGIEQLEAVQAGTSVRLTALQISGLSVLNGNLTQQGAGQLLYPQTAAEITAGVVPVNYAYVQGTVLRYGTNTTPGTTNMTTPIQNAITVMNTAGGGLVFFPDGIYYHTATLTLPPGVYLASNGGPGMIQSVVTTPAVTLLWGGGAASMVKHGYTGTTGAGGGLLGIALNGAALATNGLDIKDIQKGTFERL